MPPLAPKTRSFSAPEVERVLEPAEGGHAVCAQRSSLLGADPRRDRRDLLLLHRDVLGVEAALHRVRVHLVAGTDALHARAHRHGLAGSVVSDHLGEAALADLELARADLGIPHAHPGGHEADENLVGLREGTGSIATWSTSGPP